MQMKRKSERADQPRFGWESPSVTSSQASSIRGRPTTQGGRRGRTIAPSRGAHHQTDLDDTPHDSSVSPPCRMRHPCMTDDTNEKKDRKG